MEVAILGGGNFGTAIANIVAKNGYLTHLWMRDEQQVADCIAHRENRRYLPGHPLEVPANADRGYCGSGCAQRRLFRHCAECLISRGKRNKSRHLLNPGTFW